LVFLTTKPVNRKLSGKAKHNTKTYILCYRKGGVLREPWIGKSKPNRCLVPKRAKDGPRRSCEAERGILKHFLVICFS
jgi:hypothetical protein